MVERDWRDGDGVLRRCSIGEPKQDRVLLANQGREDILDRDCLLKRHKGERILEPSGEE